MVIVDASIRRKVLLAFTEDSKLHIQELMDIYRLVEGQFDIPSLAIDLVQRLPVATRDMMLAWSESVLVDRWEWLNKGVLLTFIISIFS